MPRGRAASTAAVAIDGADSKGKANDNEVRGDAAAVHQEGPGQTYFSLFLQQGGVSHTFPQSSPSQKREGVFVPIVLLRDVATRRAAAPRWSGVGRLSSCLCVACRACQRRSFGVSHVS